VFQDSELRQTILESSVDEISIIPGSIAKTGNWVVPEGHYLIVCHQDKFVDKYEQINANFHILNCLLQELTACGIVGGAPVKAEAAPEQAQAPAANPGRLHSPLLGR
jgi:hypothetical protein